MTATCMAVYLDCAATTPLDPRVRDEMMLYFDAEFGNAGSRTHDFGRRAREAVETARDRVAAAIQVSRGGVFFTSGATESNNLALLGLRDRERRHIVVSSIEHHAVLEPVEELRRAGFEVTYVPPGEKGWVDAEAIAEALRPDTVVVAVMHANNETGILQPIGAIADGLGDHPALFHVDAAQTFGMRFEELRHPRIDTIAISGHKIHGPKGAGALLMRKRGGTRPALRPLTFGGGQERGLRPGTLPVPLIAGLGKAAELALAECAARTARCLAFRQELLHGLAPLHFAIHGDATRSLPHIVNLSVPGFDAETVIEAWKDWAAISDGAACTSASFTCSHVLSAMGLSEDRKEGAVRLSWCATTAMPNLDAMVKILRP